MRFFELWPFFLPPGPGLPTQQAISSVTHTGLGIWHPSASFIGKKPPPLYLKIHFFCLFLKTLPTFFLLTWWPSTHPLVHALSYSPALLHTSLVVSDTITSSLHPRLTGIELKESVKAFSHVFTQWISGNALPNTNEANQKAAAATVSLHIYI